MKTDVAGPESIHYVVDGNLLEKLKLSFPDERPRGCNRLKTSCGTVKRLLECAGALLAFHLLSVAVGIAGVVAVAVLLVGLMGGAIKLLLWIMPMRHTMFFDEASAAGNCYFNAVTIVGATLLVASIVNLICALVVASILVLWCASGALLFHLAFPLISVLLRIDVQLANYISSTLHFASVPDNVLQPEECAKRFETDALRLKRFDKEAFDRLYEPFFHPVVTLATRLWRFVLDFAVCKAIVGGLSAAAVFCCVVQPALSIFSGGHAPMFSSSLTFQSDPTVYVLVLISCCVAGAVGLGVVAALSTKLTWRAFGDRDEDQAATPDQEEQATSYTE